MSQKARASSEGEKLLIMLQRRECSWQNKKTHDGPLHRLVKAKTGRRRHTCAAIARLTSIKYNKNERKKRAKILIKKKLPSLKSQASVELKGERVK